MLQRLLTAGAAAPSLHNSQPWRFRLTSTFIEVCADPTLRLRATDPDGWAQRLACGAAVFNLRMAMLAAGFQPGVTMFPNRKDPTTLARIVMGEPRPCPPWARELYEAIPRRHSMREPFAEAGVPVGIQALLSDAARLEGADLLVTDDAATVGELARLLRTANIRQRADQGKNAELAEWTARTPDRDDGVQLNAGGPRPDPDALLALRDFTQAKGRQLNPNKRPQSTPTLAVLSVATKSHGDDVLAGQALQRVLLTATAHGLVAAFLSQVVEDSRTAKAIATTVLRGYFKVPRMVLRIGYGIPLAVTKRRPISELIQADSNIMT